MQIQLGRLICSLQASEITKELLDAYVLLADPKANLDKDVVFYCAHAFPGVLLTVGAKEWPLLKVAYINLVKNKEEKVKTTLLLSIHKVAEILGPKITAERLDSIMKDFLAKEPVKLCFNNLHKFLAVLNETQRQSYLELLKSIVANSKYQWRTRELFALHANDYAKLFDSQVVYKHIFPIMCSLVKDIVSEVRIPACKELPNIIFFFQSEPTYFSNAISFVQELAMANNFRSRQAFLMICERLMDNKELFEEHFLTEFLRLQKDRVVNVRIELAKVLRAHMNGSAVLASNIHITRTIEALKEDNSKEVKENISEVAIKESKENINKEVLERAQKIAASMLTETIDDEEVIEEIRRQENERILKNTIKIDEVDYEGKK